ncbi:ATP-binding protein [Heyndrickxia coagulans]
MYNIQVVWGHLTEDLKGNIENSITLYDFFGNDQQLNIEYIFEQKLDNKTFFIGHEDYASVKEFFLEKLPFILESLMKTERINECIIQNPPKLFLAALKRVFKDNIHYVHYQFEQLNDDQFISLSTKLKEHIIGQEEAIEELLSALYLFKKRNKKPLILMFFGPEGVGKTETAKIINEVITEHPMLRKQFSMFQSSEFVSYLYGDKENQNSFAKELLLRKSNIVLLDEFDKCPSIFHSAFYQLFDEGIFSDRNYDIEVNQTIFICTSNYTSISEIKDYLGGPIYSRFDSVIQFTPLSIETKEQIIKNSFMKNLSIFTEEEKSVIYQERILEQLLQKTYKFSNAREIDNVVRILMANRCMKWFMKRNG